MTLKNINEEVGVIKAHLEQDKPDLEFIVRHAEALLFMAHDLASDRIYSRSANVDDSYYHRSMP